MLGVVGWPTAAASCRTSPAGPGLLVTATRFCRNADRRLHRAGLANPLPVPGRAFLTTARSVDLRAAGRAARRPRLELQPLGADWTRAHRTECHAIPPPAECSAVVYGRVSHDGTRGVNPRCDAMPTPSPRGGSRIDRAAQVPGGAPRCRNADRGRAHIPPPAPRAVSDAPSPQTGRMGRLLSHPPTLPALPSVTRNL